LADVAARQHGVVTAVQLDRLGLNGSATSKRVRAGSLHRIHRGVYALGHRRLSQEGLWIAAVLAAGDGAALAGLSAAALWQIWRRRTHAIEVLAPGNRRPQAGFRLHTCRRLDPRDVTTHSGIPVTTVARTLVDLSDALGAHQLANVIHEAAFRKRFDAATTRQAMARANGRHGLAEVDAALKAHEDGSAGTRSDLEDRFLALVHAAGLPPPLTNVALDVDGRQIEVDFRWSSLCVEIDGDGHARPRTRREDNARDAALRAGGYTVLRFSREDIETRAATILAALQVSHAA
jgi:predicted transcriptional regulator of viral defense system